MDTTPAPCLLLEGVSREFGGLKAVDGVSLTIHAGERHAIIGPNGAGKTTLFNVISGEVRSTAGRICLDGVDVARLNAHERAARGMARTFQITRLFQNLTVLENMLLACQALDARKFSVHRRLLAHADLVTRSSTLLGEFGLTPLRAEIVRSLSYGDQRKLEVALAMAGRPRLLLLDEPMAGLPSGERAAMRALLERLDPAMTVLLIEHDIDVAFAFATRATVLMQGRVIAAGPTQEVAANRLVQDIYLGTGAGAGDGQAISPAC